MYVTIHFGVLFDVFGKKLTTVGSVKKYFRVYTNLQDKNNIRQLSVNIYITNIYTNVFTDVVDILDLFMFHKIFKKVDIFLSV